ncbi:hypothetical protein GCM10022221_27440 [Actinocorallia aurea]
MRKIVAASTIAGAGALALVFSSPALALTTVTGGGAVTAVNSGNINFQDVTAGITAACTSGSGAGSVPNGTNTPVGSLSSLSLSGCSGSGITFTLTVNVASSAINVTGLTNGSGVTPGSITGVTVSASALGGLCKLTAGGGSLNGSYTNSTGALTTTSATGVTVTSVTAGCLGLVKKNDVANLTGTFIVKNSSGGFPQIIST